MGACKHDLLGDGFLLCDFVIPQSHPNPSPHPATHPTPHPLNRGSHLQLHRLVASGRPHANVSCWTQAPQCLHLEAGLTGMAGPHILQVFELCAGDLVAEVQSRVAWGVGAGLDETTARDVFAQVRLL
jgi:hypothetical protein